MGKLSPEEYELSTHVQPRSVEHVTLFTNRLIGIAQYFVDNPLVVTEDDGRTRVLQVKTKLSDHWALEIGVAALNYDVTCETGLKMVDYQRAREAIIAKALDLDLLVINTNWGNVYLMFTTVQSNTKPF